MGKVYFLFGVHNHQPVGNFDSVFRKAYQECYLPFILTLERFPNIKCSIHNSGPLYDWFLENAKEYIEILKKLIKRGQVEIISGGYYEPILPIINEEDRYNQIKFMNDFIRNEFNTEPKGIWIAERVWEQYLAKLIHDCNLKYTFLDDTHFRYAGLAKKEFFGYYTTEEEAKPIYVFAISKTLRYKIPFSYHQEAIDLLNSFVQDKDVLITLFDDGEKFGLWPNTFDWVYNKGWLSNFFSVLSQSTTIETITPKEAVEKFSSSGLIYFPAASYEEMGEWVLLPESFYTYEKLENFLKEVNRFDEFKDFIRGGFFRNFYNKYDRLNYMHKRMLYLSRKINQNPKAKSDLEILKNLWKAQTNCSYWHGIFGGFYLGHLRSSVYEHLVKAQKIFEERYQNIGNINFEKFDIDLCGREEILVNNKSIFLCFSQKGGCLLELSIKNKSLNLLNTVTRQKESYHKKLSTSTTQETVATIHQIVKTKEPNLDRYLIYDNYQRLGLVDHILEKDISIDDFNKQKKFFTLLDIYQTDVKLDDKKVNIDFSYKTENIFLKKTITVLDKAEFLITYKIDKQRFLKRYNFGVEFNFSFLSLKDIFLRYRKKRIPLQENQTFFDLERIEVIDEFKKLKLIFNSDIKIDLFSLPIYTVSSSEDGFEKVYQEICLLFIFKQISKFSLSLKIEEF